MEITVRLTTLIACLLWLTAVGMLTADTLRPGGHTAMSAWAVLAGIGGATSTLIGVANSCTRRLEVGRETEELVTRLHRQAGQ